MKLVTTFTHGVCDYLMGLLLLVGIPVAGLARGDQINVLVPQAIGLAVLLTALLTRYDVGVLRWIPMPLHLVVDGTAGIVLALSPWLFNFANSAFVWTPHVLVGTLLLVLALVTDPLPRRAVARP